MILTHLVLFSFFDGASQGSRNPTFSGFTTIPPTYAFFDGFSNGSGPTPPTPTPLPETGGGGPSEPLREWRWYEGQELRPNWYLYPEERRKLKRAIQRVVRAKARAQQELKSRQYVDVSAIVETLQRLQEQLNYLLGQYAQMMAMLHAKRLEDEEESEIVELLLMEITDG